MTAATAPSALATWFAVADRGTSIAREVRAGCTTFVVMAYIIFVNPIVLGYVGVPGLEGKGLPFAPALIVVGFYMMTLVREIPWDEWEEALPAFVTMLGMPFTWSITNGIGAGFVTWTVLKVLLGKGSRVHPMVYAATAAFILYFALPLLEAGAS